MVLAGAIPVSACAAFLRSMPSQPSSPRFTLSPKKESWRRGRWQRRSRNWAWTPEKLIRKSFSLIMDLKLPPLGEGADSGTVVNLFVKEGDQITKDQPILELENEKAVATIPSTSAGTIGKIFVKTGEKISVGQRILSLSEKEEKPRTAKTKAPSETKAPKEQTEEATAEKEQSEEPKEPEEPKEKEKREEEAPPEGKSK